MERTYWLDRKRQSVDNAKRAKSSISRLIHLDLAGRYSVKAASAGDALARGDSCVERTLPPPIRDEAEHYEQLETGARWLASRTFNEAERHEHLAMATKYARLRLEASVPAHG